MAWGPWLVACCVWRGVCGLLLVASGPGFRFGVVPCTPQNVSAPPVNPRPNADQHPRRHLVLNFRLLRGAITPPSVHDWILPGASLWILRDSSTWAPELSAKSCAMLTGAALIFSFLSCVVEQLQLQAHVWRKFRRYEATLAKGTPNTDPQTPGKPRHRALKRSNAGVDDAVCCDEDQGAKQESEEGTGL